MGSFNGAQIDITDHLEYLSSRAGPFISGRDDPFNVLIPVPIIIYSSYEFEGQEHSDRSLYFLIYAMSPIAGQGFPMQLLKCGRLTEDIPKIDFLVDPWVGSMVGYEKEPSNSLMFNCGTGEGFFIHVDKGQFRVQSNLSTGQGDAPQGGSRAYSITASAVRFLPARGPITVNYRLIDIGGPVLGNVPQLTGGIGERSPPVGTLK
jgi:hypothetical protein